MFKVSGVTDKFLEVESGDVKYILSPEQLKERLKFKKEYIETYKAEDTARYKNENENLPPEKQLSDNEIEYLLNKSADNASANQIIEKYTDENGVRKDARGKDLLILKPKE